MTTAAENVHQPSAETRHSIQQHHSVGNATAALHILPNYQYPWRTKEVTAVANNAPTVPRRRTEVPRNNEEVGHRNSSTARHSSTTSTKNLTVTTIIMEAMGRNMERSTKITTMREASPHHKIRTDPDLAGEEGRCLGDAVEGQYNERRLLMDIEGVIIRLVEVQVRHQGEECPTGQPGDPGCALSRTLRTRIQQVRCHKLMVLNYLTDRGLASRRPPGNNPPLSPRDANFGRNAFSPGPGQGRRPGMEQEQMVDQMSGMDLNNQKPRMPAARTSSESQRSQRSQGDYGRPPMNGGGRGVPPRGYPPQGYPDAKRGPPPGQTPSYDNGYGPGPQGPPRNDFGPPGRSMTMPVNEFGPPGRSMTMPVDEYEPKGNMRLQRTGTMPLNSPAGQGAPQRPSTAAGHRPPPQRIYESNLPARGPPQDQYGGYENAHGYRKESTASFDDVYDAYFEDPAPDIPAYNPNRQQGRTSIPDFDAIPPAANRGSFEQVMRPVPEQRQQVAHQTAQLNHAKSQPDLRQSQTAVFEMAGDIPSVPPHAANKGPSAPPSRQGHTASPSASMRHSSGQHGRSPDSLPSHPAPVRPGLMANSMVSLYDKPPPVRNYGSVSTPIPYQQPAPAPAPQHQQQQQPQQQAPPVQRPPSNGSVPKQAEVPVTAEELEHLRRVIKGNPSDQESALKLAKRLVEAAEVLVPKLPDPKSRSRARDRYLVDSHKILKKLSNAQNPAAMFFMADSIGRSLFGNEPDNKEAFTLYQSAAKLGHPAAAYRTAVCCEIGHEDGGGTRRDPLKAIQWYKRAATLGDPPAMYKVGMILLKGLLGQPKNPREAVGWLKRAAERADAENPHALHELGLLYESAMPNDAIVRDEAYALDLFNQAAELGYKFSQYKLGCTYEYGLMGCQIDPRLSIMWYSRAATQEEHQAELALSGWYLTGSENVLSQSDTEAYLWARKAAIAGLAKAEYAMGYFTEVGIGVPTNMEDAKRWYWRAAAQDYPKARERLEDLKRSGKNGARQRERISRGQQQDGECSLM
ncbi:hypothetical protein G7046_g3402 [Stylonectria norvegica]|nr:hypothetical protein G7046_g3402 [Stylonectria norvegica]